jgi:hypothetical protein
VAENIHRVCDLNQVFEHADALRRVPVKLQDLIRRGVRTVERPGRRRSRGISIGVQRIDYSLKMTTVALPFSGIDPPLDPEATATYCLPLTS